MVGQGGRLTVGVALLLLASPAVATNDVQETADNILALTSGTLEQAEPIARNVLYRLESSPDSSSGDTYGTMPGQEWVPPTANPDTRRVVAVVDRAQRLADRIAQTMPDVVELAGGVRDRAEDTAAGLDVPELLAPEGAADQVESSQTQAEAASAVLPAPLAQALVVATVAGAAGIALWLAAGSSTSASAGVAARGAQDLRRLLPYASPLFTRFERDTVLGHPRREALYALILQTPGISLQALGDAAGLSRTATLHHLRLMEKQHLIVSRRMGRSRHFFENGGRFGREQKEAYAVLQNDRSRQVADYIRAHPGTHQKDLCTALSIPPSIAHWHVRRLQEAQLVEARREGRNVVYLPGSGMATVSAPVVPAPAAPNAIPA